jgi:hypothetical protein
MMSQGLLLCDVSPKRRYHGSATALMINLFATTRRATAAVSGAR